MEQRRKAPTTDLPLTDAGRAAAESLRSRLADTDLAARWLGLPPTEGRLFRLDTATISVLGFDRETRVLLRWNDDT